MADHDNDDDFEITGCNIVKIINVQEQLPVPRKAPPQPQAHRPAQIQPQQGQTQTRPSSRPQTQSQARIEPQQQQQHRPQPQEQPAQHPSQASQLGVEYPTHTPWQVQQPHQMLPFPPQPPAFYPQQGTVFSSGPWHGHVQMAGPMTALSPMAGPLPPAMTASPPMAGQLPLAMVPSPRPPPLTGPAPFFFPRAQAPHLPSSLTATPPSGLALHPLPGAHVPTVPPTQRQRQMSLSPPRSRASSTSTSSTTSGEPAQAQASPTHPKRRRRSSSPRPSRHLDRIADLYSDASILSTRLYSMIAEEGGPVVTIVDRNPHMNYSDSIRPHRALEWYPSGRIRLHPDERKCSSVRVRMNVHMQELDRHIEESERQRRRRKRGEAVTRNEPSSSSTQSPPHAYTPPNTDATPTSTTDVDGSDDLTNQIISCLRKGGRNYPLDIFRTSEEKKGWGLCSPSAIPVNSLVIIFTGEIITSQEATRREKARKGAYMFDVKGFNLVYDAWKRGGPARFLNHDDESNLRLQVLLFDGRASTPSTRPFAHSRHQHNQPVSEEDKALLPLIVFYARRNIPPFEELTFHYDKPYI